MLYRDIGVTAVNLHSKPLCGICYKHSYGSKAYHTKFLALYLIACKVSFFLFYKLRKPFCILVRLHPVDSTYHIPCSKEESCYNKFLNRISIGSRSIKYNYSLLCTFIKRDIVNSGTCSGYGKKIVTKFKRLHVCTSYKNRICLT